MKFKSLGDLRKHLIPNAKDYKSPKDIKEEAKRNREEIKRFFNTKINLNQDDRETH